MNDNFAKLIVVGLVAGVAKALFSEKPPVVRPINVTSPFGKPADEKAEGDN